jgi:hypothetical protein
MTKQRKVYAAFLGLAAIAFIGDQVLLQPSGAGAAAVDGAANAPSPAPEGAKSEKSAQASGPTLATKLQSAGAQLKGKAGRDPFRRGSAADASTTAAASSSPTAEPATPAEFAARYELRSVLSSQKPADACAVLAKRGAAKDAKVKPCREGDEIEGWKLTSAVNLKDHTAKATFQRGSATVELEFVPQKVDNTVMPRR